MAQPATTTTRTTTTTATTTATKFCTMSSTWLTMFWTAVGGAWSEEASSWSNSCGRHFASDSTSTACLAVGLYCPARQLCAIPAALNLKDYFWLISLGHGHWMAAWPGTRHNNCLAKNLRNLPNGRLFRHLRVARLVFISHQKFLHSSRHKRPHYIRLMADILHT